MANTNKAVQAAQIKLDPIQFRIGKWVSTMLTVFKSRFLLRFSLFRESFEYYVECSNLYSVEYLELNY